jgi:predicted nucleotide-binding protein
LEPFILQNQDGGGKTLIEALEQRIYDEAAFGIVLVTPDDYGYAKADGEEARSPRARPNVILEMGMVMAALGRDRMVILKKGEVEMPSDTQGLIYLGFNDRVQDVVAGLVKRLKAAGIEIDDALVADAAS